MRVSLDTNRYADLMRGDGELASQLASCEWVGVPFVVVAELRAGFSAGKKRSDNEQNLTRFLARLADIAYRRRGRMVLGWVVATIVIIGLGTWVLGMMLLGVWAVYRIGRGWWRLNDHQPMPA